MISLDDVSVVYGGFVLLDKINFHISDSDKIGLVGKNGAGKSTILKMIAGLQRPSSGQIDMPPDMSVGYLPQLMEHNKGFSVLEETMKVFAESKDIEKQIASITEELSRRDDYESDEYSTLIARLTELGDRQSLDGSEPAEILARKTLLGLGFKDSELSRRTETFSQGWNMRIELAKILLKSPRLLLLDEPTNHLDIESIEWLEDYLKNRKCALLLVSHDRRFLDNVTGRTIELMLGKVHDYKVPYSKYIELRRERLAQQKAAYDNQQRMIQKTEDFIRAFRYKPTKSNQVQSRIKALEKLERVQIDETDNVTLSVKFPPAPRSGDVVFKAAGLSAAYPSDKSASGYKVIFSEAEIEIKRGEKVALIGRNGEGKTTLMRVITGELPPYKGEAKLGHNVDIGYFAQNQEDVLDGKESVFSTLDRVATGDIRSKLRDILAQFLFRGEDIDKRVSVLSGGERARLGMAMLMLGSHNLLLLDEPTNHMDIKSKDILKQALKAYDGTMIVVSHDRDFLEGLVDKIYEFHDGRVNEHLGGVSDFLARKKIENLREIERCSGDGSPKKTQEQSRAAADDYRLQKERSRTDRKTKNRISYLEAEISKYESLQAEIEKILSSPGENDDIMELTRSYLEYKRNLDALTSEWFELNEK